MQRTIITLALIAGLTGPACAQVGRADLLALDDEALVSAYLAAMLRCRRRRGAGSQDGIQGSRSTRTRLTSQFAGKVRAAIRAGQLDGEDFVLRRVERQRKG